jgi:hypothetical protein
LRRPSALRRDETSSKDWAQFSPADKADCVELPKIARVETYTQLLTCLQLARNARKLRESERDESVREPARPT